MHDYSLLIGNGINNLSEGNTWNDVLNSLGGKYHVDINTKDKPFPLAYEEIYFKILKNAGNKNAEIDIKNHIAEKIRTIKHNEIHKKILDLNCCNIMTTNYDLAFEGALKQAPSTSDLKNKGVIKEQRYSIFRHHCISDKKIWHIHGDINVPNSITLGYEHYSGHLQSMRNYVTTGSRYSKEGFTDLKPLTNRLNILTEEYSWIDSFFIRDMYIVGLTLDFVEIDLWWLLTFRERNKYLHKCEMNIHNRIMYYLPSCFLDRTQYKDEDVNHLTAKIELLRSVGVQVNSTYGINFTNSKEDQKEFYLSVITDIHSRKS